MVRGGRCALPAWLTAALQPWRSQGKRQDLTPELQPVPSSGVQVKSFKPFFVVAATFAIALSAHAQSYPNKPIKLIIPFPPGGATDMVGRIVADALSKELGQPVVVDNRTGSGGSIGTIALAKSAPDGYTLGIATVGTHAANPACNPKGGYDPVHDFAPISNVAATPNVLTAYPEFPAKNTRELIAYLKKNPGKVSFATGGTCGIHHLTGEMFKSLTGTAMEHVPYRGSGPALTDVAGGRVELFFDSLPGSLPFIKTGKIRPLAVAWDKRLQSMPDVPTYAELGLKPINDPVWYGLVAPAKTPEHIIKKLNAATVKMLAQADVKERIAASGSEAKSTSPAEFATEISTTFEKIKKVVKENNVKLEEN
jgi:tripartite-type tricarboxylate transporter receptor subunit TctC